MFGLFSSGFVPFMFDKEMIAKELAPVLSTLSSSEEVISVIDEIAAKYGWSLGGNDYEEIFMMAQMY